MVRINLLPHREQKRHARQRQFISMAIGLAVLGIAVVGLVHVVIAARIDNQGSRNKLLQEEIAKLDEQIKEIDRLRDQIQAVLARKQVVETLQANRSEAVHLLDQLVRQLPASRKWSRRKSSKVMPYPPWRARAPAQPRPEVQHA